MSKPIRHLIAIVAATGEGPNWDINGGTCGFRFAATYAEVLTCHAGATVTSASS